MAFANLSIVVDKASPVRIHFLGRLSRTICVLQEKLATDSALLSKLMSSTASSATVKMSTLQKLPTILLNKVLTFISAPHETYTLGEASKIAKNTTSQASTFTTLRL